MKNIVIVSGSMREGNTLGIAKVYSEEFIKLGYTTKIIALSDKQYAFCNGCLACDETQECVIKDGFNDVINTIRNADLIVFGTPARWRLLSGELKTFLDRLNPFAAVEGYVGLNTFVYAVGQSDIESIESINTAAKSVCTFAMDAGMEVLGTQAFCSMLTETDYLEVKDEIRDICREDAQMLAKLLK